MRPNESVGFPISGLPGRSGIQASPPPGATVLQPIVEERVREVVKEHVQSRFIEVPQVYYVEKVVEVPREIPEEKIVKVVKPVKKEIIKYVKKPVFVDKIVEVPEVKYVDKIVEIPRYSIREKIVEVPKVLVIERIIPVLKSYRKEQVVYVDPGGEDPWGQPRPQLSVESRQTQSRYMQSGPRVEELNPFRKPSTDIPFADPRAVHAFELCHTPPHAMNRQRSNETCAVKKSVSAPAVAHVASTDERLPTNGAATTN